MADGKVKISELSQALQLNDNAVFPYTQDNGGTDTTFKAPMTQIARKINEDIDFTNLETSSKKVVGAINQTVNNFAEVYDPTSTYNQNDPVLYGGTLYKCNANNVTGAWDSTKWDEAKAVEFGSGGGGASYATELPISSTDPTDTKSYIDDKTTLVKSASGDLIHITDGGDNIPMKSCEVTIEPIQASGTPTPSTPLPISGHTECNLVVCGKNLLDIDNVTSNSNAQYKSFGALITSNIPDGTLFLPQGTYTFSVSAAMELINVRDDNGDLITSDTSTNSLTFTLSKITNLKITLSKGSGDWNNYTYQLEKGSTATPFEAYNGTTYTFTFGQTVYGGRLIYENGQWSIEATYGYIDLSTISWNTGTANRSKTTALASLIKIPSSTSELCGTFGEKCFEVPSSSSLNTDGQFAVLNTGESVFYRNVDTPTGLLVYSLATPVIIPITTSTRVKTLSGENNIFSNCGDTAIEYFTESADEESELFDVKTGGGYKIQPVIYSTDEREIGVWSDGKPLYEKTIDIAQYSVEAVDTEFRDVVAIADADFLVSAECSKQSPNTTQQLRFYISNGYLQVAAKTTITLTALVSYYVTIRYTKSTDTAGSGQWTPQGVPAHHYSTNEQIVGTWIDGSTLYEKTVTGTCPSKGAYGKVADITSETITNARIISGSVYRDNSVVVDVGSLNFELYLSGGGLYGYSNDNSNTGKTVIATIQYTKASS